MKRYAIIGCLWFLMASAMIHGNARAEIDYEIRYDSNTKQTYELKQKIQDIYSELVRGVHKESYILMVLHNKELFAYRKDLQADWKQNQLVITEGDGKEIRLPVHCEQKVCVFRRFNRVPFSGDISIAIFANINGFFLWCFFFLQVSHGFLQLG